MVTIIEMSAIQTKYSSIRYGVLSNQNNLNGAIGNMPNSWAYDMQSGTKYLSAGQVLYGSSSIVNDKIQIKIDLRDTGTLEILKNDNSMGTAFSGLRQFGDLYFAFSMAYNTDTVTISNCWLYD
jgi:hypothetical protein